MLKHLSNKIRVNVQPVLVSKKIKQELKAHKFKPTLVNQQRLVYKFHCDLCYAGYVGYKSRHFHQCVEEHKYSSSSIGKHFRHVHRKGTISNISSNCGV